MFKLIVRFNRFIAAFFGIYHQETHYISVADFTTDWVNHPDIQAFMKPPQGREEDERRTLAESQ